MVLLFLSLAIWTSNSATVEAFNCSGGYHKHVDDDGNPPQQQAVSVQGVAVKATHTTNAQTFVQGWLDLMFRGSDIRGHSPYCLAKAYTPGANLEFEWLQSAGDIADPGDYDLEVRVCVAEQIGSQRACQQVKSAGTASEPGILIRALTTSGVED